MEIKNLPQKIYKGHGFFKRTKKERKFAKKKVLENTLSQLKKELPIKLKNSMQNSINGVKSRRKNKRNKIKLSINLICKKKLIQRIIFCD